MKTMKKKWIIKIKGTETFVEYVFLVRLKDGQRPICTSVNFGSKGYNLPRMFDSQEVASETLFAIKNKVPLEMVVVEGTMAEYKRELYKV